MQQNFAEQYAAFNDPDLQFMEEADVVRHFAKIDFDPLFAIPNQAIVDNWLSPPVPETLVMVLHLIAEDFVQRDGSIIHGVSSTTWCVFDPEMTISN